MFKLPLTLLLLLRLMLLSADSLASRLWCPGCCCWWWSCSRWNCSLMLLASWMAFITASWSPNNAVEFRLAKMSAEDKLVEMAYSTHLKWFFQRAIYPFYIYIYFTHRDPEGMEPISANSKLNNF